MSCYPQLISVEITFEVQLISRLRKAAQGGLAMRINKTIQFLVLGISLLLESWW